MTPASTPQDFDFLIGRWQVSHRRLKQRLLAGKLLLNHRTQRLFPFGYRGKKSSALVAGTFQFTGAGCDAVDEIGAEAFHAPQGALG